MKVGVSVVVCTKLGQASIGCSCLEAISQGGFFRVSADFFCQSVLPEKVLQRRFICLNASAQVYLSRRRFLLSFTRPQGLDPVPSDRCGASDEHIGPAYNHVCLAGSLDRGPCMEA